MEHFNLMRRILNLSVLCLAAGVVSACLPEEVVVTEIIPTAGVRFIHAVPDTGAMDFRFVDIVESNAHWNVAFRNNPIIAGGVAGSQLIQFKNARAGSRRFKIFMYGTTAAIASQEVLGETTQPLEAGKLYTAMLWGYANPTGLGRPAGAQAMALNFYEEIVADPTAQVGLRVINTTSGTISASHYPCTGSPCAGTVPATATWPTIGPLSMVTHATAAPGQIRFNVTGTTPTVDALALVGVAATTVAPGPFDAIPGTTLAGSAVTAIVWPRSVAGTQAPQLGGTSTRPSFLAPAITFMWDRRPPRPTGV